MKLRRVSFNAWIPEEDELNHRGQVVTKKGTNCWEEGYPSQGWFHRWAVGQKVTSNGIIPTTVAIVELPDGTVRELPYYTIKFLNPPGPNI